MPSRTRRWILGLALMCAFSTLAACIGQDRESLRTVAVLASGTGSGHVTNVTQGIRGAQSIPIDCTINRGVPTGTCIVDFTIDFDFTTKITLRLSTTDSVSLLGGDCRQATGHDCELEFGQINRGARQTKVALFSIDSISPQPVIFSDDFDATKSWQATAVSSSGAATHLASLSSTGGSTGGFRRMEHGLPPMSSIVVFHRFDVAGYDPLVRGAITSVDYQEKRRVINPPFTGAAVGTAFAIEQNGTVYLTTGPTFSSTTWETWTASGLVAADFTPAPGPDFSASAPPLFFGYTRSNTNNSGNPGGRVHGIDDWHVVVHR